MLPAYQLREICRLILLPKELPHRQIARMTGSTHQTVGNITKRIEANKLRLEELDKLSDNELVSQLYPKVRFKLKYKIMPDIKLILNELQSRHKSRKSLMLLYLEYKAMYGERGYGRSQFYKIATDALKASKVTMKQVYLPGEILFIDYAGTALSYKRDVQDITLNVFVGCLGYSQRRFAFATTDMTSASWCQGLVEAFEYFGGVPEVIQFDNAKAMVTTPGQLATFHRNIAELAHHYGCICDTSRVGTPTDNGLAEHAVKYVTQRILVSMNRDLTFFSHDEVNRHLIAEVDKLNTIVPTLKEHSPNELFFSDEFESMRRLPTKPFEPVIFRKEIQTPANYLVRYLGNEYSVPFELAHKRIEIKVRGRKLYVLHQNQIRAIHDLIDGRDNVVRLEEHLKPEHRAELSKTLENYLEWAKSIGSAAELVVELQYRGLSNPNSRIAGKYCRRLQKLCHKYGPEQFEEACSYAYTHNMPAVNDIELVLKAKPYLQPEHAGALTHSNIRGADYFGGHRNGH